MRVQRHFQDAIRNREELNVDGPVAGSVIRSGDRVRISAQLIQATNGSNACGRRATNVDLRDVLSLQADLARTIADQIKIQADTTGTNQACRSGRNKFRGPRFLFEGCLLLEQIHPARNEASSWLF